eukprot:scaffold29632_cov50-Phaeocystis_antarctica.AAC.1
MEEEIAERKRQEQELLSEQELEEEARLGMEEHYNSLQEEADAKTRKLKKLWGKYKGAQAEVADLQAEFQREKEDILDTIRELSRQLKLKQLIMSSFIPLEQLSKIERRSEWDEATETWRIARIQYAGNAMRHKRRDPPRSPETGVNSPTSRRGLDSGDGPPLPDVAAELSSVFFSYQPDPAALAEEEAALSAEQEAANEVELAQRSRMNEMQERQRRRQEQSELDAVMGL